MGDSLGGSCGDPCGVLAHTLWGRSSPGSDSTGGAGVERPCDSTRGRLGPEAGRWALTALRGMREVRPEEPATIHVEVRQVCGDALRGPKDDAQGGVDPGGVEPPARGAAAETGGAWCTGLRAAQPCCHQEEGRRHLAIGYDVSALVSSSKGVIVGLGGPHGCGGTSPGRDLGVPMELGAQVQVYAHVGAETGWRTSGHPQVDGEPKSRSTRGQP
jgi:hypothetical protein